MTDPTPSERLRSAINLLSGIAIACLVLGMIAVGPLLFALLVGRTKFAWGHLVYVGIMALCFVAPAALYWIVIRNLRRRQQWAAVMGIVVASIHATAGLLITGLAIRIAGTVGPTILIPAGTALLLTLLTIRLIHKLARLLKHLHELDPTEPSGFMPIMHAAAPGPSADADRP